MAARNADPIAMVDPCRDELVTYLAQRLGVPHDVALSTLGDWLLEFERTPVMPKRAHKQR